MPRPVISCAVLLVVALSLVGCSLKPTLSSIQVIPNGASLTTAGQTVQFKAIGTYNAGNHPATTSDITTSVAWESSDVKVITITSSGLATAVGSGSATITASIGTTMASSNLTVAAGAVHDLTSIEIIPNAQAVTSLGEPTQFIAIGTNTTSPMTVDLTNQVSWQSSDVKVATINSAGLALGNYVGTTTITAIGKSNSGALIVGTSTLTVQNAVGGVLIPALTIYSVGLGTGTVTSILPLPVGIINCSPASIAGCTGSFVFGTPVVLTAAPSNGSTFGGWSSNCTPDTATTCTVQMNNNQPVGAIFN
jgi:hypothetical protein